MTSCSASPETLAPPGAGSRATGERSRPWQGRWRRRWSGWSRCWWVEAPPAPWLPSSLEQAPGLTPPQQRFGVGAGASGRAWNSIHRDFSPLRLARGETAGWKDPIAKLAQMLVRTTDPENDGLLRRGSAGIRAKNAMAIAWQEANL